METPLGNEGRFESENEMATWLHCFMAGYKVISANTPYVHFPEESATRDPFEARIG
jgi:hypothetical protein